MPDIDPNWLNLLGQCLNLWGGILLGLEAIGAAGFLQKLEQGVEYEPRVARSSFTASLNNAFVFVFMSLLGLAALLAFGTPLVAALLIAPTVPFAWNALGWMSELVQQRIQSLGPPSKALIEKAGNAGCAVSCLWGLLWLPVYVVAAVFAMVVKFGLDIPLRFASERFIAPLVLRVMRASAKLESEDARWHFRKNAFRGLLLVLAGFLYQAVAAVMELLSDAT